MEKKKRQRKEKKVWLIENGVRTEFNPPEPKGYKPSAIAKWLDDPTNFVEIIDRRSVMK